MNEIDSTAEILGLSPDHMFPILTAAQQSRVADHGRVRSVESSETLVESNVPANIFFIVARGHLNTLKPSGGFRRWRRFDCSFVRPSRA